jgi:uncharacterized protein YoxC
MTADITREEFESRVGLVEREVEGEKMVTRHILEQTRRNGDDLAGVKTRLDRVEHKVDGLAHDLDSKFRSLGNKVDDLTKTLPKIVGEAMREVLRDRDSKA